MNVKTGFIGAGKMAGAIIKGIINSGFCESKNIIVSDKSKEATDKLKSQYNITTSNNNRETVKKSDIIVAAVKPFVLRDVLYETEDELTSEKLLVSIAAGISIATIEEIVGKKPVVRVMPNTPALVGKGMSAVCKGKYATDEQFNLVLKMFDSVGKTIGTEEKFIDVITAVSGSGPAYFYYFINEIAKAGEKYGLDRETALLLSTQTAYGAAAMTAESGISPEQLIINVTTPGGCTEAGNNVLKECEVEKIIDRMIKETAEKAAALGKKCS